MSDVTVVAHTGGGSSAASARPERRVWRLTAAIATIAVGIAVPQVLPEPRLTPDHAWLVLLLLFGVAEAYAIDLPTQRGAHSQVLREIPAVVGLTLLTAPQYLTAYVLGAGLAVLVWPGLRGLKLAFNVALFTLEAALSLATYHAIFVGGDPIGLRAYLAAGAAVLVLDLVSAAGVTTAISLTESRFDGVVLRAALRTAVTAGMINTLVGLLVVTIVVDHPAALPLLAGIVVMLVLGYRVHVALARGYTRLELLYRFVGSTGRMSGADEVVTGILSEAVHLLHATGAQLVLLPTERDGSGAAGRSVSWHDGRLLEEHLVLHRKSRLWWRPCLEGTPVLVRHETSDAVEVRPFRDGIAVPLRIGDEVDAVLLVTDRTEAAGTFGEQDLRLFETLGAHAAVALAKARVVDSLRQLAEERAHEALHDPLTGLPNRRAFRESVERIMEHGERAAVLLLDLDDFKDVNDTLGHSTGDRLLKVTGRRLTDTRGATDTVAYLGGDEFAVLLPDRDAAAAFEEASRLHRVLSSPVPLEGTELHTSASIGVTVFRGSSRSGEEVLSEADVAMYAAKTSRAGVAAYRPGDGDSTARRLSLAADLKSALRERRLEVWYQPQASAQSGRITGCEALLRWNHPRFGWVPPPEIVTVAHRVGLTAELTAFVLRQALGDRAAWVRAGHALDVSVNVTPADIADDALVPLVETGLHRTGTPPAALVLEITETDAMRDPERSLAVLDALAVAGVRLSVDDFGTGHSSLAHVDRFPVHELKIDRSFVSRLEKDATDSTIVRATITLAHDLGLRVVAEGVESELARSLVAGMGCDLYQGYGLARPMPAAELMAWLDRRRAAG